MQVKLTPQQTADDLLTQLEKLGEDRAALSRLRRCAGRPLSECPEAFGLFYRLLPGEARGRPWLEEACFLVATLYPAAPGRHTGDLGASLLALAAREPNSREGLDRRMSILLDCTREELVFRLRQVVRLLASKDIGLDWRQLLVDLLEWDREDRRAQKRWARGYFGG